MVHVILSHEVKDFATWKQVFDAGETFRAGAGVKTTGVYTAVDNPNYVTVTTEFPNAEAVQQLLQNKELRAAMQEGGVIGAPDVKVLNKA